MIGYHLINKCFSYGTFNTLCKDFHGTYLVLSSTEGNRLVLFSWKIIHRHWFDD